MDRRTGVLAITAVLLVVAVGAIVAPRIGRPAPAQPDVSSGPEASFPPRATSEELYAGFDVPTTAGMSFGERVGLSIDAFLHRKHGFDHPWEPQKYPYCWTGWGAYNFNTYFLHAKTTTYLDNFGDNQPWRERFAARAITA